MRKQVELRNVSVILALFIALGGTSYALTLPRNSVGFRNRSVPGAVRASEVRSGAVRSSEVKDRSLGVKDLSPSARRSLRCGRQEAQARPVRPESPGLSGVTYRAAINSCVRGKIRGNVTTASPLAGFSMSSSLASIAQSTTACPRQRWRTLKARLTGDSASRADHAWHVRVGALDRQDLTTRLGPATSLPFHLIVACST